MDIVALYRFLFCIMNIENTSFMNRSYIFWITTILGILIGVYLYFRFAKNTEHFEATEGTPTASATTEKVDGKTEAKPDEVECPVGDYTEDMTEIPYYDKLMFYLSSFSTATVKKTKAPYCPNLLRWFNLRDPTVYFNVNTVTPPASVVGKGMPMKNIVLIGPPSDFLKGDDTGYDMRPFTLFFCSAMNTPDFSTSKEVVIFRIYAETPNSVRLTLKPSDLENRTQVELVLGAERNRYVWDVTTSTLVSNSNPTLYAITVDTDPNSEDKVATFYIGKTKYTADVSITSPIKLGNSRMEINSNGNMDASMYSIGFIDHKLTESDIGKLGDYMLKQQAGGERRAIQVRIEEEEKTKKKIEDLEKKLGQCSAPVVSASTNEVPKKERKWLIKMPTDADLKLGGEVAVPPPADGVDATDATATVKEGFVGEDKMDAPVPAPRGTENTSKPAPTSSRYGIVYKTDLVPSTVYQNTTAVPQTVQPPSSTGATSMPAPTDTSKTAMNIMGATPEGIEPPYYTGETPAGEPMPLDMSIKML